MQGREFEGNTLAKGTGNSADAKFENTHQFRSIKNKVWKRKAFSETLLSRMTLHPN